MATHVKHSMYVAACFVVVFFYHMPDDMTSLVSYKQVNVVHSIFKHGLQYACHYDKQEQLLLLVLAIHELCLNYCYSKG